MKKHSLIVLLLLYCQLTFSREVDRPSIIDKDWVEIQSTHPVILNLVKPNISKKISESPAIMVQEYPLMEKWQDVFKSEQIDHDSCFIKKIDNWDQLWCLKSKNILVVLSKKTRDEDKKILEEIKKWVKSHE